MSDKLTKRQKYNLKFFYPKYYPLPDAEEIVIRISNLGSKTGFIGNQGNDERRHHKYDTWIAKVVKDHLQELRKNKKPLNLKILDKELEFQNILDWMVEENVNAFDYNFQEALIEQEKWHQEIAAKMQIEKIEIPQLDPSRIIYRCKNQEYFFYMLEARELKYEGAGMGNCVGGLGYQKKVKNNSAIIVSLRDKENKPHVTIEILLNTKSQSLETIGIVSQCHGKYGDGGITPKPKYLEMIQEFVLFSADYYNDETMKFMNKQYF